METDTNLRRRRLRLNLRAMMVVVVGIAGVLGWVVHRAHVQRDAVAAITTARRDTKATVFYDWQYAANTAINPRVPKWMREVRTYDDDATPRGPKWLRDALGPDVFDTAFNVSIEGDNVDDDLLANVGKLYGVEHLSIQGRAAPELTAEGMAQVRGLSRLKVLSAPGIADSRGFLAGLKGKTELRRLFLPQAAVTDDDMAIIGGFRDLEVLQVDGRNVTDVGFAHLANLKELSILDMPGVQITDLAPVAGLAQLDNLFLGPAPTSSNRAESATGRPLSLEPLRNMTVLTQLVLGNSRIEDTALAVVAELPRLSCLTIGGKGITQDGLARLAESKSLSFFHFTDTSIADLRPLAPRLPMILDLGIDDSPLADAGIAPLSGATRIQGLSLAGSRITDAGLDHLASLAALQRLSLDRTAITDAGIERLKPLRSLTILSLNGTKLTDSSVEILAGFPFLQRIDLDRSGISAAGIERLKKALPNAQIIGDSERKSSSRELRPSGESSRPNPEKPGVSASDSELMS